jgi:uncharacterized membrane protein YhaH (DUF805 family)
VNWYKEVVTTKYAQFNGRAMRTEYWMFVLVSFVISIGFSVIDAILGTGSATGGVFSGLYGLAVLIPTIAVATRRLHDTNRSGWWQLIALTIIGLIPLLIWLCTDSDPGENRYGPNPKAVTPELSPI